VLQNDLRRCPLIHRGHETANRWWLIIGEINRRKYWANPRSAGRRCGSYETLPTHGRTAWVITGYARVTASTSMAFPTLCSTSRNTRTGVVCGRPSARYHSNHRVAWKCQDIDPGLPVFKVSFYERRSLIGHWLSSLRFFCPIWWAICWTWLASGLHRNFRLVGL